MVKDIFHGRETVILPKSIITMKIVSSINSLVELLYYVIQKKELLFL